MISQGTAAKREASDRTSGTLCEASPGLERVYCGGIGRVSGCFPLRTRTPDEICGGAETAADSFAKSSQVHSLAPVPMSWCRLALRAKRVRAHRLSPARSEPCRPVVLHIAACSPGS